MQPRTMTKTTMGMLLLMGCLIPVGWALADEGYGHGKSGYSGMMREGHMSGHHEMMEHHAMSPAALKEKLGLNDDQTKALEPLELDYRKTSIKNHADLRVAMIDLASLLDQKTPDKQAISQKIDEIAALQKHMMSYRVDALLKLKGILTPAQYEKFRDLLKEHMEHMEHMMKGMHGMGGMMEHGSMGAHGYGHGMMEGHGEEMMRHD